MWVNHNVQFMSPKSKKYVFLRSKNVFWLKAIGLNGINEAAMGLYCCALFTLAWKYSVKSITEHVKHAHEVYQCSLCLN